MSLVAPDTRVLSRAIGVSLALTLVSIASMLLLHHHEKSSYSSSSALWIVMTIGMMTPSALPMLASFLKMARVMDSERSLLMLAAIFLLAYILLWTVYAVIASDLQGRMRDWFLVNDDMAISNPIVAAALVGAAGVFQFSSFKHVCLTKCRSPLGFLSGAYAPGYIRAFRVGFWHAVYCTGCCWLLMALAWVGGVMNMAWMAILSMVIILEKTLPEMAVVEKPIGFILCGLAGALLVWKGQEGFYLFELLASLCHHTPATQ